MPQVHGVGGLLGTILRAPLGSKLFGGLGHSDFSISEQLYIQIFASLVVALYAAIATFIILQIIKKITGIRVSSDEEEMGLDQSSHSESAYN